jgi:hypothetical protein
MFDGTRWYQMITHEVLEKSPLVLFITGLAPMLASVTICFMYGSSERFRLPAFASASLFFLSFLVFPLFGGLNRPWHFFILTPLFACGFIISIAVFLKFFRKQMEECRSMDSRRDRSLSDCRYRN